MPTFVVTSPGGAKYRVAMPEGSTADDAIAYMQNAVSDPTDGMSFGGKFAAGLGKAAYDTARGVGELTGLVDRKSVDESNRFDAPLMRTAGGVAGDVIGNIAMTVGPLAAAGAAAKATQLPRIASAVRGILAPQTIPGAAAVGAGMGAIQPLGSDESRTKNMLVGAAGGAAIPAAVTAGGVASSLVRPFSQGGREKIAGQALERFATNPDAIISAQTQGLIPGSMPTLAESVDDVGLSQLQRVLQNNPDSGAAITARLRANNNARVGALQEIAGDQGQREAYSGMRANLTAPLYEQAFDQTPTLTPWIKGQITQLQQRPAFQKAWKDAGRLAANEGVKLDQGNVTQVAHYAKMALDDQVSAAVRAGNNTEARAIASTRDKLVSLMESKDFSPMYTKARETYREMSLPINRMDVGQALLDNLQPALGQFGADTRVNAASYAKALRDADATAARATGFPGARLDNILTPQQLATVNNIAKELGNSARATELGLAKGSPTAQNLVGQDVLRSVLGPTGLPQSWAESVLSQTLLRPTVTALYKPAEQRVLGLLGDAAIDPELAKTLLTRGRHVSSFDRLLNASTPYATIPMASGLLSLTQ